MTLEAHIELTFRAAHEAADDDFEALLDAIQEALIDIGRVDIDMVASLTSRTASLVVFDVDPNGTALDQFWSDVRTALHTVGVATPGWDDGPQSNWKAEQRLQLA